MTPRLWLVRHATPLVAPGLCYGRLDVEADALATQRAAQALAEALPAQARVRHSPLRRCAQLAQALQALRPELRSLPDARLQEMDFGAWEGRPWESLARSEVDAWAGDLHGHAPGGGESLSAMLQRVQAALGEIAGLRGDMVWITHAGVARCVHWLRAHPAQVPTAAQWTQAAPAPGEWFIS